MAEMGEVNVGCTTVSVKQEEGGRRHTCAFSHTHQLCLRDDTVGGDRENQGEALGSCRPQAGEQMPLYSCNSSATERQSLTQNYWVQ